MQDRGVLLLVVLCGSSLSAATIDEHTLLACHYDGDTGHGGLDADVARGSGIALAAPHNALVDGREGKVLRLATDSKPCSVTYSFAGNMLVSKGTVEFWINLDWDLSHDTSRNRRVWFNAGTGDSRNRILIQSRNEHLAFGLFDNAGRYYHVRSNTFPTWKSGQWRHVACTWDIRRRHLAIWIDGKLESDRPKAPKDGDWSIDEGAMQSIRVGGFCPNDAPLGGAIDELRVSSLVRYDSTQSQSLSESEKEVLQQTRDDALREYSSLSEAIKNAQQEGLDLPYAEVVSAVARIGFDRLRQPAERVSHAQRKSYYDYIINSCAEARREIALVKEGKKRSGKVPRTQVGELFVKGDSFQDAEGQDRLLIGIRNVTAKEFPLARRFFNLDIWQARIHGIARGGVRRDQWGQVHLFWNNAVSKALAVHPEMANVGGYSSHNWTAGLCVESPTTRRVIERAMLELPFFRQGEDVACLYALLSAEDQYMCYCSQSATLFQEWLKDKHKSIDELNAAWSTRFEDFDAIVPSDMFLDKVKADNRAAWSDWLRFNRDRVTEFYGWLKSVARRKSDRIPLNAGTHFALSDSRFGTYGIDVEALNEKVNDVAQSETMYGSPTRRAALDVPAYGMDIFAEARVDFQRSTCGLPVTDLEFHGWSSYVNELHDLNQLLPRSYTSAIIYRHYLHGVRAANIWVYKSDVTKNTSFCCSPVIPLESVDECLRAALDIRRLTPEITALTRARPEVGIFFSDSTFLQIPRFAIKNWHEPTACTEALKNAYHASLFLDTRIGFVSERTIAGKMWGAYKVIVIPGVSHVPPEVFKAIMDYVEGGGVIVVTPRSFLFDQYHRRQTYLDEVVPVRGVRLSQRSSASLTRLRGDEPFLDTLVIDPGDARLPGATMTSTGKGILGTKPIELVGLGIELEMTAGDGEVIASLDDGSPGIISKNKGKGRIILCAMDLKPRSYARLLDAVLTETGIEREIRLVDDNGDPAWGVEARACRYKGDILLYAINLLSEKVAVVLHSDSLVVQAVYDNITEQMLEKRLTLSPLGTVILRVKVARKER